MAKIIQFPKEKMKTPPQIQKLNIMVSSIALQFDAMSVHHEGVQKWKIIDPSITPKKASPVNI